MPAYKPSPNLISLAHSLIEQKFTLVVVNDGSPAAFDSIFNALDKQVILLKNATNIGKGGALKHGFNYILNHFTQIQGIITLDCDGQHSVDDALKLARAFIESSAELAIGVRDFGGKIPFRSKFGNTLTRNIFKIMFGKKLKDTQSGLRVISPNLARTMLASAYNGYEFEMQMLINACYEHLTILQVPIQTIYIDNNASSHFNPVLDSLSIYFVLFRHIGNSLLTALIDYAIFALAFSLGASLFVCMLSGRIVAGVFNFMVGKHFVFKTKSNLAFEITTYTLLMLCLMFISMQGIAFISHYTNISEIIIKPICELMIFAASFLVQRFFIFAPKTQILDSINTESKATNWEQYYAKRAHKGFKLSLLTRKISANLIINLLKKYSHPQSFCEFGGGDSCFYESIRKAYPQAFYIVFDNATNGVKAFNEKYKDLPPHRQEARLVNIIESKSLSAYQQGLASASQDTANGFYDGFDVVFSAGLIEHFDESGTKDMCLKHFMCAKSGGIVLLTYPTPTLLYRCIRFCAERCGMWEFHDERALLFKEVHNVCKEYGELKARRLNAYIGLTQEILVYQKF
nr:glycosyltransferase [Helicobacter jaachi]